MAVRRISSPTRSTISFSEHDQGFGSALTIILIAIGSMMVGVVFMVFGAGTLALGRDEK